MHEFLLKYLTLHFPFFTTNESITFLARAGVVALKRKLHVG